MKNGLLACSEKSYEQSCTDSDGSSKDKFLLHSESSPLTLRIAAAVLRKQSIGYQCLIAFTGPGIQFDDWSPEALRVGGW